MPNFKALLVTVLAGAISVTGVVATTQCGGIEYNGEVDCGAGYNCVKVTPCK